jgi:hypothetical protein
MASAFQRYTALHMLEMRLHTLYTQDEVLDQQAHSHVGLAVIILAVVCGVHLLNPVRSDGAVLMVGICAFIYGVSALLAGYVLLPKRWIFPLVAEPAHIMSVTEQSDDSYYAEVVKSYSHAIQTNENVIRLKARVLRSALGLMLLGAVPIVVFAVLRF